MKDYYIHESSYIDEPCEIGAGTKIWHFLIMKGCRIGRNCNIGQNVMLGPDVVIGDNVKIQNNVSVYTGVICEDDVFIGPSAVFTNVINPRSHINRKMNSEKRSSERAPVLRKCTIVWGTKSVCMLLSELAQWSPEMCRILRWWLVIRKACRWVCKVRCQAGFQQRDNRAVCPECSSVYSMENDGST